MRLRKQETRCALTMGFPLKANLHVRSYDAELRPRLLSLGCACRTRRLCRRRHLALGKHGYLVVAGRARVRRARVALSSRTAAPAGTSACDLGGGSGARHGRRMATRYLTGYVVERTVLGSAPDRRFGARARLLLFELESLGSRFDRQLRQRHLAEGGRDVVYLRPALRCVGGASRRQSHRERRRVQLL